MVYENVELELSTPFEALKKMSSITVIVQSFCDQIFSDYGRYLNPTLSVMRLTKYILVEKYKKLCDELILIPKD